nr:4-(2'-carboxyphenyl)-4-oxybutyric acid synthase [Cyanidiaceae sp.]
MYLLNIKFYKYCVKVKSNINNKKVKTTDREGVVFKFIDLKNNTFTWSEVAPLPCFSFDSLKFSYFEILRLKEIIPFEFVSWYWLLSNINLLSKISEKQIFPCLHCCVTLGIYNLIKYRIRRLVKIREITARLNSLINCELSFLNRENRLNTFDQFRYGAVKFKLRDLTFMNVVCNLIFVVKYKNLCSSERIRIDTNRKFSLEQNFYLFQRLGLQNLDYFEEPINQIRDLFVLIPESICPVVLDELSRSFKRLLFSYVGSNNLVGLVIKPSITGSLCLIVDLINFNFLTYKFSILSSIFEINCSVINFLYLLIDLDINLPVGFSTLNLVIGNSVVSLQELNIINGHLFLCASKNSMVNTNEVIKL